MKNLTSLFLLMVLATIGQSQTTCPSDALNDSLLTHDMEFSRSFFYMEHVLNQKRNTHPSERSNELYTLPVVVHIIHNGEGYGTGVNITDEQVFSAIEALNEDFRRMPGTNGFGDGVDVNMEFCLAARDPQGQPTNGIVRVNGSSVANYTAMGIESSGGTGAVEESVKALSTWPRTSYVNIWVVSEIENNNAGGGIQGYAYFPTNNPVDGIVVLYNAFGTVGNLKSYTNMNRTLTHELGHYLGLYHTFNSTSACGDETSCSTQGDRVCDTPPTIQAGSCSSPACGGTQQVANYMDYTSQTCQDMFTDGQKLRMRTTLETQRTSMLTSMGCMPVFQNDIGITAVLSPSGTNCSGGLQPQVTLGNFGGTTLTSATIYYNVDGVGSSTFNWTGSLASGATTTVTLGSINPAGGNHTFYAWSGQPNGTSDQNASNDQSTGSFGIISGSPAELDVVLDYYGNETSWTISDQNNVILMSGGPYVNGQQGLHNITPVCLATGCYTLTMNDVYGDGQGFSNGSFTLSSSTGAVLATGSGNWGDISVNDFCITETTPVGDAPVASFTVQDNTLCRNIQNDYTSTSTNTPTSYSWTFEGGTPASSTAQNPQNVTYANAGSFDVTLTVSNEFGSDTYVCANCVTVYADPAVTLTSTNPGCGQNTGSISSNVTGNGPYTYAWNNTASTANLSNLGAGTYSVTVTSAQGCSGQASATLTMSAALSLSSSVQQITCAGANNGSISLTVTGGSGNKTYTWSNGASSASINNLAAGTYSVNVADAAGCTASQSFTITSPSAIAITGSANAVICFGDNNGSIQVNATGGTGNKTFTWNNGMIGTAINGLVAGSYSVTVTDEAGCTASQSFTVGSPSAIAISGVVDHVNCFGENNGSITVSASGGSGAKSFTWSNGNSTATIANAAAGVYSVTATDLAGCDAQASFTINQPAMLELNLTDLDIACGDVSGSAIVGPAGGTPGYNVNWSNGQTGYSSENLNPGNYSVTLVDNNNCEVSGNFTITQTDNLVVLLEVNHITCFGAANGSIDATITGGDQNYTLDWNNGATTYSLNNLLQGQYSLFVIDGSGCSGSANIIIEEPAALVVDIDANDVTCNGAGDGSAQAIIIGGTAPFQLGWSNGQTLENLTGLNDGNITLNVVDAHGCTAQAMASIEEPSMLVANIIITGAETCAGNNGSAEISVDGGVPGYAILWSNGMTGNNLAQAAAGTYNVAVSDANGCALQMQAVIAYECETVVPPTQLMSQYCNTSDFTLDGTLACDAVEGADQYMWRVSTTTGTIIIDEFTADNQLPVALIPDVDYSSTYIVGIKARVAGVWGPFGDYCSVSTESMDLPVTGISAADCGATINAWGTFIHANVIPNVLNYEWHITGDNYDWTAFTATPELEIVEAMLLVPGESYLIEVRCAMGAGVFTEWSATCGFNIALEMSVDNTVMNTGLFNVYPNPGNGEYINILNEGFVSTHDAIEVNILDGSGKQTERFVIPANNGSNYRYVFNQRLASGFYVMIVQSGDKRIEKKIIVH